MILEIAGLNYRLRGKLDLNSNHGTSTQITEANWLFKSYEIQQIVKAKAEQGKRMKVGDWLGRV